MFRELCGFCGGVAAGLALDHDVKVDELLGEGGHVVLEAEGIFANGVGGEDVVALALARAVEEDLLVRVFDFKVDVKGAAGLDLTCSPSISVYGRIIWKSRPTYSEVELAKRVRKVKCQRRTEGRTPIFSPALSTSA